MSKVPVGHVPSKTDQPCPVKVSAEIQPGTDQRLARIEAMTSELADRQRIIQLVSKFGGFDPFVAATLKLEGAIGGLQESLTLAPPPAAPQKEEAHYDH